MRNKGLDVFINARHMIRLGGAVQWVYIGEGGAYACCMHALQVIL